MRVTHSRLFRGVRPEPGEVAGRGGSHGDGDRSEAAGLEDAVWVLGAYLAGSAVLGYAISVLRDLFGKRRTDMERDLGAEDLAADAIR